MNSKRYELIFCCFILSSTAWSDNLKTVQNIEEQIIALNDFSFNKQYDLFKNLFLDLPAPQSELDFRPNSNLNPLARLIQHEDHFYELNTLASKITPIDSNISVASVFLGKRSISTQIPIGAFANPELKNPDIQNRIFKEVQFSQCRLQQCRARQTTYLGMATYAELVVLQIFLLTPHFLSDSLYKTYISKTIDSQTKHFIEFLEELSNLRPATVRSQKPASKPNLEAQ